MREEPPRFNLMDELDIGKNESVFTADDTPAIIMYNPKYPHNVGTAVRACSIFGARTLLFTGERDSWKISKHGKVKKDIVYQEKKE